MGMGYPCVVGVGGHGAYTIFMELAFHRGETHFLLSPRRHLVKCSDSLGSSPKNWWDRVHFCHIQ